MVPGNGRGQPGVYATFWFVAGKGGRNDGKRELQRGRGHPLRLAGRGDRPRRGPGPASGAGRRPGQPGPPDPGAGFWRGGLYGFVGGGAYSGPPAAGAGAGGHRPGPARAPPAAPGAGPGPHPLHDRRRRYPPMKPENTTRIQFDSLSVNEGFARGAVAAFLARYDPTVPQMADIKTAVSEAVTNCIVHAYPDRVGPIVLTVSVYPGRLVRVTVADRGVGIPDVAQAMEPLYTTGNPEERSGLGFAVMQSFMDGVRVASRPARGTRVTLTKRLAAKGEDT